MNSPGEDVIDLSESPRPVKRQRVQQLERQKNATDCIDLSSPDGAVFCLPQKLSAPAVASSGRPIHHDRPAAVEQPSTASSDQCLWGEFHPVPPGSQPAAPAPARLYAAPSARRSPLHPAPQASGRNMLGCPQATLEECMRSQHPSSHRAALGHRQGSGPASGLMRSGVRYGLQPPRLRQEPPPSVGRNATRAQQPRPAPVSENLTGNVEPEESDEALARKLQQEEDERLAREEARWMQMQARMDELEAQEEAHEALHEAARGHRGPPPYYDMMHHLRRPRNHRSSSVASPSNRHGHGWGALAMGLGGLGGLHSMLMGGMGAAGMGGHRGVRDVLAGAARTGLPAHLLLSDRDFTAEDYDWLCRLDESVENRKGASKDEISALPTQVVDSAMLKRSSSDSGSAPTCTICLEEYQPGCVLRSLQCLHRFHKDCIDMWLQQKANCPVCQRPCKS